MSDFDDGDTGGQGQDSPVMAELRKQLKQAQKDLETSKEVASRAARAERELAFAKAGIDLADKRAGLFMKGYDGELEPEKVKAAWGEYFGTPQVPTEQQQPQAQVTPPAGTPVSPEYIAFSQMDAATSGSPLPDGQAANLLKGMRELYEAGAETAEVARFLGAHGYPVAQGYE